MSQKSVSKKLILDLVLTLILLIACIVGGTYAWMSRNASLKANNPNMQIFAPDVVVRDYTVYQYNSETNKVDDVTTESGIYQMTQYDSIFLERNVYTPLLFKIDLGEVTPGALSVNVYCDSTHRTGSDHYTSNVVCVKAATAGAISNYAVAHGGTAISTITTEAERQNLFDAAANYFKTNNTKGQFCTVAKVSSGGGIEYQFTKQTTITFNFNLSADDIVTGRNDEKTTTIYLIVDYEPTLVEAQQIQHFSNIEIQGAYTEPISYPNDITTIFFSGE